MSETEGGEEKQLFSYSQIHRKEDLQVCLGEFKEVFREIQPGRGKLVKFAGEWLSIAFLVWKKERDAEMCARGSSRGSLWDLSFRAFLRDTAISMKEITARKSFQVGELSWLLPTLQRANLTFHALGTLTLGQILKFVEDWQRIQV